MPEEVWFYLAVIFAITAVISIVLFLMEREKKRRGALEGGKPVVGGSLTEGILPLSVSKSVPDEVVKKTRDRLRVLDVEREILSYAIRRLYEAHAEGKITVEERDSLALKYKEDLERIKQEIARGESIIALNDLERMQEEFIKMFSEKFEVLNRRIEELKSIAGLAAPEQISKPKETEAAAAQPQQAEKTPPPRKKREAAKPKAAAEQPALAAGETEEEKSEAEKRVEQIMAEIEKVLSRLSQMEVEE